MDERPFFVEDRANIDSFASVDSDLATYVFRTLLLDRGALHIRHLRWPTETTLIDLPVLPICSSSWPDGGSAWVFELAEVLIRLYLRQDSTAEASLAASRPDALRRIEERLLRVLPRRPIASEEEPPGRVSVPVSFWNAASGPVPPRRALRVPTWDEISGNYAATTRGQLAFLFSGWQGGTAGQLILWHGPPGTGKTFAIRALAASWRHWCEIHYVVDPEQFFGDSAYMLEVLMAGEGWYDGLAEGSEYSGNGNRWRLLVLEDTGELLTPDAKATTGQALSRLLNIVDGLLGQSLPLLILITTNEPLAALHPAVSRPGRCAAVVEFSAMSAAEANAWLSRRADATSVEAPTTIAELYRSASNGLPPRGPAKVGFG